jgi:hypothetical protein
MQGDKERTMSDPAAAKIVLELANGSITLINALLQTAGAEKGKKNKTAPTLSAFVAALPAAAISAADALLARLALLRNDCISAGLNLNNPIGQQGNMLKKAGERMRDRFQVRLNEIALQVSVFFDDIAALAQCMPRRPANAKTKTPNGKKAALAAILSSNRAVGDILDAVQKNIDESREELRSLLAGS